MTNPDILMRLLQYLLASALWLSVGDGQRPPCSDTHISCYSFDACFSFLTFLIFHCCGPKYSFVTWSVFKVVGLEDNNIHLSKILATMPSTTLNSYQFFPE